PVPSMTSTCARTTRAVLTRRYLRTCGPRASVRWAAATCEYANDATLAKASDRRTRRDLIIKSSDLAKSDHGIHSRGAPGGHVARQKSHDQEKKGDSRKCRWIGGPHPVEKARQGARKDERAQEPQHDARGGEPECLTQNGPKDVSPRSAQSKANRDFASVLGHQVGDHSVDSDRREKQRSQSEQPDRFQRKSPRAERRGQRVVEHLSAENGKRCIHGLHLRAHLLGYRGRIELPTQKDREVMRPCLVEARIDLRRVGLRQRSRSRVGDHADDRDPRTVCAVPSDTPADRVLT